MSTSQLVVISFSAQQRFAALLQSPLQSIEIGLEGGHIRPIALLTESVDVPGGLTVWSGKWHRLAGRSLQFKFACKYFDKLGFDSVLRRAEFYE
jgi:hypothetical protein